MALVAYIKVYLIFLVSGVFWIVSAEGFALCAGAIQDERFIGVVLGMVLAATQLTGYLVTYHLGQFFLNWSQKLRDQVEKLDKDKLHTSGAVTLFLASVCGVPPLAALAVVAGTINYDKIKFMAIVFTGRSIRFSALFYFGTTIVKLLEPIMEIKIPEKLPFPF